MPRNTIQSDWRVADYPGLADLLWDQTIDWITPEEAYAVYEQRWQYLDVARLSVMEKQRIRQLIESHGGVFAGRGFDERQIR